MMMFFFGDFLKPQKQKRENPEPIDPGFSPNKKETKMKKTHPEII